jgi:hypothetical protein
MKMVASWKTLEHWPAWFQTITPDFHGSKDQVILLFLPAKIPPTYRGHIIFIDQPLNKLFKVRNSLAQIQADAANTPVC